MKINFSENNIVYLNIEDKVDKDYYYSKLCFNDRDKIKTGEQIKINYSNKLAYDIKRNEYIFPNEIDEYQRCFLLRLVIDSIQLKKENLPLHASAISNGKTTIIVSAKPGEGKSFIADEICKMYSEYYTIGDDHIIISPRYIQGNLKRRIRTGLGSNRYADNKGIDDIHKLIFISFDFSSKIMCAKRVQKQEAFMEFKRTSAFKYLNEIFEYHNKKYGAESITDLDIHSKYLKMFYNYTEDENILSISGTPQYAIDQISNIIVGINNIIV